MSGTVLVTGGFGLVGTAMVRRLAADGRRVVAVDLDTPANRKAAEKLPNGAEFRWADLTDRDQVERLVSDIAPEAIIHLAAIIAPAIYRMPKVARRVNVDLVIVIAVAGFFFGADAVRGEISAQLSGLVGKAGASAI